MRASSSLAVTVSGGATAGYEMPGSGGVNAAWTPLPPGPVSRPRFTAAAPLPMYEPNDRVDPAAVARSLHQELTPLIAAFFSQRNADYLQAELQRSIRAQTGHAIGRQDDAALVAIMRAKYLEYADFGPSDVRLEVSRLNAMVLAEAVTQVGAAVGMHIAYLRDASRMPEPMARSLPTSVKGTKVASLFRPI